MCSKILTTVTVRRRACLHIQRHCFNRCCLFNQLVTYKRTMNNNYRLVIIPRTHSVLRCGTGFESVGGTEENMHSTTGLLMNLKQLVLECGAITCTSVSVRK